MLRKNKIVDTVTLLLFIVLEAVFFVLIQIGISGAHNYLCFSSVVLAFVYASLVSSSKVDSWLTALALLFTVFSDYCLLLVYPEPRIIAMTFFNAVQLCYFLRLATASRSRRELVCHIAVRLFVICAAIIMANVILSWQVDTVSLISMIYFANLATNMLFAFYHHDKYLLFAIGLLSFACCDIFVGLGVLVNDYLRLGRDHILWQITHSGVNFIWLFYVPSQTLIAISARGK